MDVAKSQRGGIMVLAVHGALTAEDIEPLNKEIEQCIADGKVKIVLDLVKTPYIDSAGLERIHVLTSELGKRGGDVRVSGLNDVCKDIFRATRLESVVQLFDSEDGAVKSLS